MLKALIQSFTRHPGTHPRDAHNAALLRGHAAAGRCLEFLIDHRFTVRRVRIDGRNPVIEIEHDYRCLALVSVAKSHNATTTRWVAVIEGCQVEWDACALGGHAAH